MKEIRTSKGVYKVTEDGDISDGYHSFEELYKHRMLYNAAFFKELSSKLRVERSKRHSDGELCFGGGWFIVVTELPQGQISNHYENKYWDLFDFCETVDKPTIVFDGHDTIDVLDRILGYVSSSIVQ